MEGECHPVAQRTFYQPSKGGWFCLNYLLCLKRATREYNTYITYTFTFNYYYFPPGNRPAHAHIKGGWPGPDTIHNGGHIQKKKLSGTNARAFRMRYSAFTENNGILHLSAHAYDQRYIIYTCTVLCVRYGWIR